MGKVKLRFRHKQVASDVKINDINSKDKLYKNGSKSSAVRRQHTYTYTSISTEIFMGKTSLPRQTVKTIKRGNILMRNACVFASDKQRSNKAGK